MFLRSRLIVLMGILLAGLSSLRAQVKFQENQGQWESNIQYRASIPSGKLMLNAEGLHYVFLDQHAIHESEHGHRPFDSVILQHIRCMPLGAKLEKPQSTGGTYPESYHYYNDKIQGGAHLQAQKEMTFRDIYPGIDWILGSDPDKFFKYSFRVKPGADFSQIKLKFDGANEVRLSKGRLEITHELGQIIEEGPVSFTVEHPEKPIRTKFILKEGVLSFQLIDPVPSGETLIIDPKVIFSTYSGSSADNWGFTATYDKTGHAYSGGTVYDFGLPQTTGTFQMGFVGGVFVNDLVGDLARDASILKYSPDGDLLLWGAYLGGTHNEQPHSMVVNSQNDLLVLGSTFSTNFPKAPSGYNHNHKGESDIFVVKITPDGSAILSSTLIGGTKRDGLNGSHVRQFPSTSPLAYNYGDEYRGEIIVDANDRVLVASCTESTPVGLFPLRNAFQSTLGGGQDGCIFRLSADLNNLEFSSYIGGTGTDALYGLGVDGAGRIFACGGTTSGLNVTMNGDKPGFQGGRADGFIIRLSAAGTVLEKGTYVGGTEYDQTYMLQVDKHGYPYVVGQTRSGFPISTGAYGKPDAGQFIARYHPDLNTILRSTSFGKGNKLPDISISAFLVDRCERIFVSGWGGQTNTSPQGSGGNTNNLPTTGDAFQDTTDGSDFYLIVLSRNMDNLVYASYWGGGTRLRPLGEHVDGGTSRFDYEGRVYQSICGGCGSSDAFPTTPNAWSRTNNSDNCNNALFKIDFENLNMAPNVNDQLLEVTVGDELNFDITATDGDKYDSLVFTLSGAAVTPGSGFPSPMPVITGGGFNPPLTHKFSWKPTCAHLGMDTIEIKVLVNDNGCPIRKLDSATIRIVVKPPPLPPPPDYICLKFTADNDVLLDWSSTSTDKYFGHYLLKRKDPLDKVVTLFQISDGNGGSYLDKGTINPKGKNYCYWIEPYNMCDQKGDDSYIICSADQFNNPIASTQVFTASVENDKDVTITWFASHEPDFKSYEVYRKRNQPNAVFELYATLPNRNDTVFVDTKVDVDEQSYCYTVVVTDNCGFISHQSNMGCNIVLKGNSVPFMHTLTWMPYNDWGFGVQEYQLYRSDEGHDWSKIYQQNPSSLLAAQDEKLDYDWGLYRYEVRAFEDVKTARQQAISRSNSVALIQPPLLHVPNAFTANGDGLNDTWGVVPVFVKEYDMKVYNRWGQLVFTTDNKKNDWEGFYKSVDAGQNVYIWVVLYTGWDESVHYKSGTLTVLK